LSARFRSIVAALLLLLVAAAAATTVGDAASHDGVIVIVWADQGRATNTDAGDLAVARVGDRRATPLRSWHVTFPGNGTVIGAYDARWSPKRKQLALELAIWTNDPFSGLGMLDASGRTLRRLTRPSSIGGIGGWLATGTGVRWLSDEGWWLVRTGSGKATRIRVAAAANPKVHSLTWSPDGQSIAAADRRGLITMSSAGRNVVRLTRGADEQPAWSPDGRTIAFVRDQGRRDRSVYTVGSNGRGLRRLTTGIVAASPRWSPDGRSIIFRRPTFAADDVDRTFPRWELDAMDAGGGSERRLAFNRPWRSVLSADWGR